MSYGNRSSNFRIRLAHTLLFTRLMELALVELQYTKSWNNIRQHAPGENCSIIYNHILIRLSHRERSCQVANTRGKLQCVGSRCRT
jgi:hypothetical protein